MQVGSPQQGVAVRSGGVQQVLQLPMQQQATISVQVPVSTANGQTVYQTLQLPVQMISNALPGLMQSGTQMQVLSQLTQVMMQDTHDVPRLPILTFRLTLPADAPAAATVCADHHTGWSDPNCADCITGTNGNNTSQPRAAITVHRHDKQQYGQL